MELLTLTIDELNNLERQWKHEEENFIRQQTESRAFTPQALFEMEYQVSGSASAVIFKKSDLILLSMDCFPLKISD